MAPRLLRHPALAPLGRECLATIAAVLASSANTNVLPIEVEAERRLTSPDEGPRVRYRPCRTGPVTIHTTQFQFQERKSKHRRAHHGEIFVVERQPQPHDDAA